jgi:hypothetical protein
MIGRCPTPEKRHRYDDEVFARRMAAALTWAHPDGHTMEAYECSCGLWHIRDKTKKDQRHRARRRARRAAKEDGQT